MNDFIEVDGQYYVSLQRYSELSHYASALRTDYDVLRGELEDMIRWYGQMRDHMGQVLAKSDIAQQKEEVRRYDPAMVEQDLQALRQFAIPQATDIDRGYIYLIRDINVTNYCKIGCSTKPKQRLANFAVNLPFEYEIIHVFSVRHMYAKETSLHRMFADKRKSGEWFDLSPEDIEYIKSLKDE